MTPSSAVRKHPFFRWAFYGLLGGGFFFFLLVGAFLAFPTQRLQERIEWEVNQQLISLGQRPGADAFRIRIKNLTLHVWNPGIAIQGITVERTPRASEDSAAKTSTIAVDTFEVTTTWIDLLFHREQPHLIQVKWSFLGAQGMMEVVQKENNPSADTTASTKKGSGIPYQLHAKLSPLSLDSLRTFFGDLPIQGRLDAEVEAETIWPLPSSALSSIPLHASFHINDLVVGDDKTLVNLRKLLPAGSELLLKQIPPLPKTTLGSFQCAVDGAITWTAGTSGSYNLYLRANPTFATLKQSLLPIVKKILKENPDVAPLYSPLLANANATDADYERAVERSLTDMQREDKTFGFSITGPLAYLKLVAQKKEPATIDLRSHPLPAGR